MVVQAPRPTRSLRETVQMERRLRDPTFRGEGIANKAGVPGEGSMVSCAKHWVKCYQLVGKI